MITEATLDAIENAVTAADFSPAGITAVKEAFPSLRLTFCMEEEMGAKNPFRECEGFSLYLVGDSDHCLSLTSTLDDAVGVVIAEE